MDRGRGRERGKKGNEMKGNKRKGIKRREHERTSRKRDGEGKRWDEMG